jgi:hypothetical protein
MTSLLEFSDRATQALDRLVLSAPKSLSFRTSEPTCALHHFSVIDPPTLSSIG